MDEMWRSTTAHAAFWGKALATAIGGVLLSRGWYTTLALLPRIRALLIIEFTIAGLESVILAAGAICDMLRRAPSVWLALKSIHLGALLMVPFVEVISDAGAEATCLALIVYALALVPMLPMRMIHADIVARTERNHEFRVLSPAEAAIVAMTTIQLADMCLRGDLIPKSSIFAVLTIAVAYALSRIAEVDTAWHSQLMAFVTCLYGLLSVYVCSKTDYLLATYLFGAQIVDTALITYAIYDIIAADTMARQTVYDEPTQAV